MIIVVPVIVLYAGACRGLARKVETMDLDQWRHGTGDFDVSEHKRK